MAEAYQDNTVGKLVTSHDSFIYSQQTRYYEGLLF